MATLANILILFTCTFGANDACYRKNKQFYNCSPAVLTSFPGSGNTLARILIEELTGVWSGSVYNDAELKKNGAKRRKSPGKRFGD